MQNLNKQLQERIECLIGSIDNRNDYMVDNLIHEIRNTPAISDLYDNLDYQCKQLFRHSMYRSVTPEPTLQEFIYAWMIKTYYIHPNKTELFNLIQSYDLSLSLFNQRDETKQKLLELLK